MLNKSLLVFATSNKNKIQEINKLLPNDLNLIIKSNAEVNINEEIPETGKTIEENAIQKARFVYSKYNYNCFSEDTGLIVDELNGEPGIYSARYAGIERSDENNIKKVLENLGQATHRKARFKTVIALIIDGKLFTFEGIVEGKISITTKGNSGFGYDPIFIPDGFDKTFAEIGLFEKNKISHRARAIKKLIRFLNENFSDI